MSEWSSAPRLTEAQQQQWLTEWTKVNSTGGWIYDLQKENARLREALELARKVLVTACGEKAPYIRVALEKIDACRGLNSGTPHAT